MSTASAEEDVKQSPSMFLPEIEQVKQVFNRLDVNGDGKISSIELINVMEALGSSTSIEEASRMMEEIDTDRDGFINIDEFAAFLKSGDSENDGVEEAFRMYDLNKNGLISSAELHQILTRLGERCSVQDCANMIMSVDSDGDGFVNFEEFKKMMNNNGS